MATDPKMTASFTRLACSKPCVPNAKASGGLRLRPTSAWTNLLANPNLHDIPTRLPFRVEMWDQSDQHVRWVIAASASVAVGHAALDAAIANYPGQRFTLRTGRWSFASTFQNRDRLTFYR
jgi:hypothetical protein